MCVKFSIFFLCIWFHFYSNFCAVIMFANVYSFPFFSCYYYCCDFLAIKVKSEKLQCYSNYVTWFVKFQLNPKLKTKVIAL